MRTARRHSVAREIGLWFAALVLSCTFGGLMAVCYLIGVGQ